MIWSFEAVEAFEVLARFRALGEKKQKSNRALGTRRASREPAITVAMRLLTRQRVLHVHSSATISSTITLHDLVCMCVCLRVTVLEAISLTRIFTSTPHNADK